ncbi:MAG: HlyD family secretion protein [Rhizobiaceae bacterium]
MTVALIITLLYAVCVWLVFFQFRWLKFNIMWGVVTFWIGFHLMLVFLITVRFFTPYSIDGHVIRQTIQIVPRLPEPTILVEAVAEQNKPVKKGDVLYRFDRTIYEARVKEKEAKVVEAQQNVQILEQDIAIATDAVAAATAAQTYASEQVKRYSDLVPRGGAKQETLDKWNEQLVAANSQLSEAEANLKKAQLAFDAQIDGVNAELVEAEAQLQISQYYLDQTTLTAPADGIIISQQARPGLVVGDRRIGSIAALITNENPYFLATYYQEHLKLVEPGQPAEVALDLFPGQIFKGKVVSIWDGTGQGQLVPSGDVPKFPIPKLQGRFAVQISVDDPTLPRFPAGAHGAAAIFTGRAGAFEVIRHINIRLYTWMNFLFPLDV